MILRFLPICSYLQGQEEVVQFTEDQAIMDTGVTGSKTWHCRADVNNQYNAKHLNKCCLIYTGIKKEIRTPLTPVHYF